MATISQLAVGLSLNAAGFRQGITDAVESIQEIGQTAAKAVTGVHDLGDAAEQTEGRLAGLTSQAKSTVAAFLGFATMAGGIGYGVKLAADSEQTETAFATMLGSAERAKEVMADVRAFESATPFGLTELQAATQSLIAAEVAQDQLIPSLRVVGDVAAGLKTPLDGLVQAYARARSEGRLLGDDLAKFTDRGVPIAAFAEAMDVSADQVRKLASEGKLGFAELQKTLISLTSEGGIFENAMEKQSKTLTGVFSSLKSSVDELFRTFGTAFAEAAGLTNAVIEIKDAVDGLQGVASVAGMVLGTMASWFTQLGKYMAPVIVFFYVFVKVTSLLFTVMSALVAIGIAQWALAFVGLSAKILLVNAAVAAFTIAKLAATAAVMLFHAMSGPSGWAILAAGIAIAAGATYGLVKAYGAVTDAVESHNAAQEKALRVEEEANAARAAAEAAEARRLEVIKMRAEAIQAVTDAIKKTDFEIRTAGMSQANKELERMKDTMRQVNRETGRLANYVDGTTFEQHSEIFKWQAAQKELAIVEQQARLREEMLKTQKEAAQVGMTSGQRMLDDLRRAGATWQQMYAAQRVAQQLDAAERAKEQAKQRMKEMEDLRKQGARMRESLATPVESLKKQLADIVKLRQVGAIGNETAARAIEAANKNYLREIRDSSSSRATESPTALMAGTAEASLANDRLTTPMQTMADLQRRSNQIAQRQLEETRRMVDAMRNNPVQEVNIP